MKQAWARSAKPLYFILFTCFYTFIWACGLDFSGRRVGAGRIETKANLSALTYGLYSLLFRSCKATYKDGKATYKACKATYKACKATYKGNWN